MKILQDGSMGFYALRWGYLWLLVLPILTGFIFFMYDKTAFAYPPKFYTALVISGLMFLVFIYKVFIDKIPHVKLRHDSVEIRGMQPVLWEDIHAIHIEQRFRRRGRYNPRGRRYSYHDYMCFEVKDLSFYKLTLRQKIQKTFDKTPFALDLDDMSKEELELFEREIRARMKSDIDRLTRNI